MSLIKKRYIKFVASTSTDVASYNVRVVPSGQTMDYSVPAVSVPLSAVVAPVAPDTHSEIELDVLSNFQGLANGQYTVGLTAVDGAGDESDFLDVTGELDLTPPAAPTDGSLV